MGNRWMRDLFSAATGQPRAGPVQDLVFTAGFAGSQRKSL